MGLERLGGSVLVAALCACADASPSAAVDFAGVWTGVDATSTPLCVRLVIHSPSLDQGPTDSVVVVGALSNCGDSVRIAGMFGPGRRVSADRMRFTLGRNDGGEYVYDVRGTERNLSGTARYLRDTTQPPVPVAWQRANAAPIARSGLYVLRVRRLGGSPVASEVSDSLVLSPWGAYFRARHEPVCAATGMGEYTRSTTRVILRVVGAGFGPVSCGAGARDTLLVRGDSLIRAFLIGTSYTDTLGTLLEEVYARRPGG